MNYIPRNIDRILTEWKDSARRKPLLLRGARQVGKSWSVRNLAIQFEYFVEINFEKRPEVIEVFKSTGDVKEICRTLSMLYDTPIIPGKTLLFLDEIQTSKDAIKSLWFFKEDYPELHVVAAGSLLEFALKGLRNFGVGRLTMMMMYPFSFDEYLSAIRKHGLREAIVNASPANPLPEVLHNEIVRHYRMFLIVGGMPASVSAWVEAGDFNICAKEQRDIQLSYYLDFAKYSNEADVQLLRNTLQSVVMQTGNKFMYSKVSGGYRSKDVQTALNLLMDAGIVKKVMCTAANGLPLGAEVKQNFNKYIYLDTGLMLRILDLDFGGASEVKGEILTATSADLVNRGSIAEMSVGLEILKCPNEGIERELFYWENTANGASSEIDYVAAYHMKVLPIEVKAATSGKMKSLRLFMKCKHIMTGIRTSLENFGILNIDEGGERRSIEIIPAYAIHKLFASTSLAPFL